MAKSPPAGYDCQDCGCELTRAEHRRGHICTQCERELVYETLRWQYGEENAWLDEEAMFGRKPS